MRKNERAGVIIVKNNKVLLIKRTKDNNNYYIIPGGGVEDNETPKEASLREIKEELGISAIITEEIPPFENQGKIEYYFLSDNYTGEIKLIGDTNETNKIIDKGEWVELSKLKNKLIFPEKVKTFLINLINK